MKLTRLMVVPAAAGVLAAAVPALAQSASEIEQLKSDVKSLRAELEAQKKASATRANERLDILEVQNKDAVVGGDISGSFRLPGSDTSLRVYGFAEANLIKDFKATAPSDNFTNVLEQPLDNSGSDKGKTVLTAQTSRFGFETSTPTAKGPLGTKIEVDFYAYCGAECNRNRLRVRHAYGEYAGWLIGQTWSTFMDLDDLPETVDFNGPVGAAFRRPTQIRYSWNDPSLFKFQAALEDPSNGARRPNLVLRLDKTFDWGALNVRGLSHEQRVGTTSRNGRGFGVGGNYKFSPTVNFMAQYTQADGDADGAYLIGSNYPLIDAGGNLALDKSRGLVVGVTVNFTDSLRATVVYGGVRSKVSADYAAAATTQGFGDNHRLDQAHLNFYYVPLKNVELGAELIYGRRVNYVGEAGTMNRLNLQARYSFN